MTNEEAIAVLEKNIETMTNAKLTESDGYKAITCAINALKNDVWQPISESPTNDLVLIAKFSEIGDVEYVHASFRCGNDWFLPFDSYRDKKHGTPILSKDENPSHFKPLSVPLPQPPKEGV